MAGTENKPSDGVLDFEEVISESEGSGCGEIPGIGGQESDASPNPGDVDVTPKWVHNSGIKNESYKHLTGALIDSLQEVIKAKQLELNRTIEMLNKFRGG